MHKLSGDLDYINIYPIGDLHIGSPQFDVKVWNKWKNMVLNDPNGYVVIIGDMMDNGLEKSKTNTFEATIQPFQQKKWLTDEFRPLKTRILGGNQGNHEYRTTIETGDKKEVSFLWK